ncbi:hypothetical protein FF125_09500 [Aureibaculum algae]|uniref:Uncharacterized protein n=1 Tax=Aureibaculum algae TaxID=2584122 RepID=A0A5B7TPH7_9FLAO|nr:hypothetical protein [Aureibaculum algae]QCX38655.1 hypothetical protein FF125_09500 [Aureibaculum algae]
MNTFRFLIAVLICNGSFAQEFSNLESTTHYKFPVLTHKKDTLVEEKVNSFLHLKHLLHLPGQFEKTPFTKTLALPSKLEFNNWKQFDYNSNIIFVELFGSQKGKPYKDIEFFDKRTGDFFEYEDIYMNQRDRGYEEKLTQLLDSLVALDKINPTSNISIRIELLQEDMRVKVNGVENLSADFPYSSIREKLTAYGKNLLLNESDTIIRRPGIFNKLFRDRAITQEGTKYERQLKFKILVLQRTKKSDPVIYKWYEGKNNSEQFTESIITNTTITSDIYAWDSLADKKVKMLYNMSLEKQPDHSWKGTVQLGSMSYPALFKEY